MKQTKQPQPIWFQGRCIPRNNLNKALIAAHIKAVQQYDHYAVPIIEKCLHDLATRFERKAVSNE